MARTKVKDINGMIITDKKMAEIPITARMTVDHLGASFSLAVDRIGLMLEVPMEELHGWMKDWIRDEWKQ